MLRMSAADRKRLAEALGVLLSSLDHQDDEAWARETCRSMKELLGADMGTLILPGEGEPLYFSGEVSRTDLSRYPDAIARVARDWSVWKRQVRAGAWNRAGLYGTRLAAFYRTAYYNEYLVPHRAYDAVGLSTSVEDQPIFESVAQLILHHDRPTGRRFGRRGLDLLRLVEPAFRAGVRLRMRIGTYAAELGGRLDGLGLPIRLHDPHGNVLHQTPAMTRLLDGDSENDAITDEITRTAKAAARTFLGRGRSFDAIPPVTARLRTIRGTYRLDAGATEAALPGRTLILVSVRRTTGRPPTAAAVLRRHPLTPRQAQVALLMARGLTDRRIADELGISHHTARGHTEAVLRRLGIHSRREVRGRLEDRA